MSFAGLNYFAIILAAVASFVFGGVWYNVLSRQWMAASDRRLEDIKAGSNVAPYAIAFVALLVMAWMLAGVVGHLGAREVTFRNGVISGLLVWAGFVATTLIVNHSFQGAKRALTLIDGGHWLGVLLVQGAIIGVMGV